MIETSSVRSRKSSATFGNLRQSSENVRKMFGDVHQAFGTILENLWKSSESGRKSSKVVKNIVISRFIYYMDTWRYGIYLLVFTFDISLACFAYLFHIDVNTRR